MKEELVSGLKKTGKTVKCRGCKYHFVYGGMFVDKHYCNHPDYPMPAFISHIEFNNESPEWCKLK